MRILVAGGGTAGLSAAVSLARNDVEVLVIEAGDVCGGRATAGRLFNPRFPAPDGELGNQVAHEAPLEREIHRRDHLFYDGRGLTTVRQELSEDDRPYSVDHASFNRWLAEQVRDAGGTIRTGTTVTGLIRRTNHVTGVNTTEGAFYADGVFVAEGATAELVEREGLERRPPSESPDLNLVTTEIIPIQPERINDFFGLEDGDDGIEQRIHVDGSVFPALPEPFSAFLYTKRAGLVLGVTTPVDTLRTDFDGTPRGLLSWLEERPFIAPLIADSKPEGIQSGVERRPTNPVPRLANHGLAVGGKATGLGFQPFPRPHSNVSMRSGQLFADAVITLDQRGQALTRDHLRQQYVDRLLDQLDDPKPSTEGTVKPSTAVGLLNGSLRALTGDQVHSTERHHLFPRHGIISPIGALKQIFNGLPILPPWQALMDSMGPSVLFTWLGNSLRTDGEPGASTTVNVQVFGETSDDTDSHRLTCPSLPESWLESTVVDPGETNQQPSPEESWLRQLSPGHVGRVILDSLKYVLTHPFHRVGKETDEDLTEKTIGPPIPNPEPELNHVTIESGSPSPFVRYGRGFMEAEDPMPTPYQSVCPSGVFREETNSRAKNRPALNPDRCIRCGACLSTTETLEWSSLTPGHVSYQPSEDMESTSPDDVTVFRESPVEKNALRAENTLVPERLLRARKQADQWLRMVEDQSGPIDPDRVRWLMTVARTLTSTVGTVAEELSGCQPPEPVSDLVGDLLDQLDKAQHQIATRHLIHTHGTIRQIVNHHLRQLDRAIGVADEFEYPYGMFHRLEQSLDSTDQDRPRENDPAGESTLRSNRFVLETIDQFPFAEIFGTPLPSRNRLTGVLPALLLDHRAMNESGRELLEGLGRLSHDDEQVAPLIELTEDEEILWQEAGHYNVMTDVVERWRQWQREYPQFGSADTESHHVPRGTLVTMLWAARETLNRVHARMMTGLDAEVELAMLRQFMSQLQQFKHEHQLLLRNSETLTSLQIDVPTESDINLDGVPGQANPDQSSSGPHALVEPTHYLTDPATKQTVASPGQSNPAGSHVEWVRSVNDRLWNYLGNSEQTGKRRDLELHRGRTLLDTLAIDSLLWLNDGLTPNIDRDHSQCLDHSLVILAGTTLVSADERLADLDDHDFDLDKARHLMENARSASLDQLVTSLQEMFRDHEDPNLPDEHIEPSYRLVRERIVRTVDQLGDELKRERDDRRTFFRLSDMLSHYLAILSVYARRNHDRPGNHPVVKGLEDTAPLVRRLHHNQLELLDQEVDRISEGVNHRVRPPELLIPKRFGEREAP